MWRKRICHRVTVLSYSFSSGSPVPTPTGSGEARDQSDPLGTQGGRENSLTLWPVCPNVGEAPLTVSRTGHLALCPQRQREATEAGRCVWETKKPWEARVASSPQTRDKKPANGAEWQAHTEMRHAGSLSPHTHVRTSSPRGTTVGKQLSVEKPDFPKDKPGLVIRLITH